MKTIFKVSSENIGRNKFDDCYYDSRDKADKDLAERVSILSRLPGMILDDDNHDYQSDGLFERIYCNETLFSVKIESVILQ